MPGTRRTPIARSRAPLITPQVIDLYRTALKLRAKAQRSGTTADRDAAQEAENAVDRAFFGPARLWHCSIFDDFMFTSDDPPAYLLQHGRADDWRHVRSLRLQLQAADRELKKQERAARARRTKAILEPERENEPAV